VSDDTVVTILQYGALAVGAVVFLTGWFRAPAHLRRDNEALRKRNEALSMHLKEAHQRNLTAEVELKMATAALRKAEVERSVYRHRTGCRCAQCRAARLRFEREQRLLKKGFEQWTEEAKRQHNDIVRNFFVPPPPGRRIPGLSLRDDALGPTLRKRPPPDDSWLGMKSVTARVEIPKMGEVESTYVPGMPTLPFADGHQAHEGEDAPPGQPPCLCGHSAGAHLGDRDEWTGCIYCDCSGYAHGKDLA